MVTRICLTSVGVILFTVTAHAMKHPDLLNVKVIKPVKPIWETAEGVGKVIPMNIPNGASLDNIWLRIMQHSVTNFLQSEPIQRSKLGRTVKTVSAAVRPDVSILKPTPSNPTSLKLHVFFPERRINVDMTSAIVNGQLRYYWNDRKIECGLDTELSPSTKLLVQHDAYIYEKYNNQTKVAIQIKF